MEGVGLRWRDARGWAEVEGWKWWGLRGEVEGEGLKRRGSCCTVHSTHLSATSRQKNVSSVISTMYHIIPSSSSSVPSYLIFLGACYGYRMLHRIAVPK